MSPIGALMRKPTRQDSQPANMPPATRPSVAPAPTTAAYNETARVRSGPSAKAVVSSAKKAAVG